jgi:hypothetical protein
MRRVVKPAPAVASDEAPQKEKPQPLKRRALLTDQFV